MDFLNSQDNSINLILFVVLLVILCLYIYGEKCKCGALFSRSCKCSKVQITDPNLSGQTSTTCSQYENFSEMTDEAVMELPKIKDKNSGEEYLSKISDETFGSDQKLSHQVYATKRREAGDHTLQLWGVNDSIRGYATNHIGRRPRAPMIDPTSALQNATNDLRDYATPEYTRLT